MLPGWVGPVCHMKLKYARMHRTHCPRRLAHRRGSVGAVTVAVGGVVVAEDRVAVVGTHCGAALGEELAVGEADACVQHIAEGRGQGEVCGA